MSSTARESDTIHAVAELIKQLGRHMKRQASLARATWAGERHQAYVVAAQQRTNIRDLPLTANQRAGLRRQVMPALIERVQRRKIGRQVGGEQLKDLLRACQIAEPMHAQIAERQVGRQLVAH